MPEVTEEKSKDLNDGNDDPAALVESKDKKKRKKLKRDSLFEDGEKGSLRNKSKVDADKVVSDILLEEDKVQDIEKKRKEETMEKSVENVEDGANEYKRASKKRKRLAHDEDGKHPVEEVAVEESKRRKTDGRDEAKGVEQQVNGSLNGVEKSSQPKSTRKQTNSSAEVWRFLSDFNFYQYSFYLKHTSVSNRDLFECLMVSLLISQICLWYLIFPFFCFPLFLIFTGVFELGIFILLVFWKILLFIKF